MVGSGTKRVSEGIESFFDERWSSNPVFRDLSES